MSQALVNKLLEEALKVANDAYGRRAVDSATQKVMVSRANLRNGFKEAFSKEHREEFKGQTFPFTKEDNVFNKAADAAFKALIKHLEKPNTKSSLIRQTSQSITFSQPKFYRSPFTAMKKAGIAVIDKELKEKGRSPLSTNQNQSVQRGLERLHVETTAGMARLAFTLDKFESNQFTQKFFKSSEFKKLQDKYGDVQAQYEVRQTKRGKELRYKQTVSLHVAPKSKNYAGSESKDWKKVKPVLERQLSDWIKNDPKISMAEQEASPSPVKNTRDYAIDMIAGKFSRVATVTKKKKTKAKKLNSKSKVKTAKAAKPSSVSTVAAQWAIKEKKSSSAASAPLALMLEMNKRLPSVIKKNMQSPALNYRSGRFASSVEVVDVNKTPQGFYSFGYTYDKFPYQTFEPGYAQGDVDRDPRRLIDKSMREIAVDFAIGRFYTRRL